MDNNFTETEMEALGIKTDIKKISDALEYSSNSLENSEDNRELELDEESEEEIDDEWLYRYILEKTRGMDGWTYKALYGQKALDELYSARNSRRRNIIIREFTKILPKISDETKDQLFDAFSSSSAFDVYVHNSLLDMLGDLRNGWNWEDYGD